MLHVLVLEDDPIIAMDIKSIVDDVKGFHGFIASDMQNSLKIAAKHPMHIIISDIQIKGTVDGIETTRMLQNLYNCQVIFLTSYSDEATLARASALNSSGYILKPFREEELVTSLKLCALKVTGNSVIIEVGSGYRFDKKKQQLFLGEEPIMLTPKEQQLFLMLLHSRGKVVPLAYIDEVIWCDEVVGDTTRRQLFHRLRKKLPSLPFRIIKYSGYVLD